MLIPNALPKEARISLTRRTRFAVSSGLPPRSFATGYSQSMSTPWNPYVVMKVFRELIKAARLLALDAILLLKGEGRLAEGSKPVLT